ncbi:MAG: DUF5662 family protein [Elusimicrobiota bacterium]
MAETNSKKNKDKTSGDKIILNGKNSVGERKISKKNTKKFIKKSPKKAADIQAELDRIEHTTNEKHKIDNLIRHIENVRNACILLGKRLIDRGEIAFGKQLICNSMAHDISKFSGIEWEYLVKADPHEEISGDSLSMAMHQHVMTNDHHPEKWGKIDEMPRLAIAEMVCDLYARSSEFATDLRQYIKTEFAPKHNLSLRGKGYKSMKFFIDILLDAPLKTEIPHP